MTPNAPDKPTADKPTAGKPTAGKPTAAGPLLDVRDLYVQYQGRRPKPFKPHAVIRAVDGISFSINAGETFGLVGESGCGKSTTARAILGLAPVDSGEIWLEGHRIDGLSQRAMLPKRRIVQMIFQDPFSSLNPRMTIGNVIAEPMINFELVEKKFRELEVMRLLELVGLNPRYLNRYPHEFSGGQRQRVGIARALAAQPKLIVCDEPVSALDVSIQAQVLNLLAELQDKLGLSYLFIAHDLAVVRHISDRIGVMYQGKIVETAESQTLYRDPQHEYTKALLSAVPIPDPARERQRQRIVMTPKG